jgi:NifB/MoaA-like Fe-S oxidoreductase
VGLTKWRQNLPSIKRVDQQYAQDFIADLSAWEGDYRLSDGNRFVYLSDEWFILAGQPMPPDSYYDDYSMIENGVGQSRDLENRLKIQAEQMPKKLAKPTKLTFATATLPYNFLMDTLSPLLDGIGNLNWNLIPVKNDWYGADFVTVAGLLPARDVVMQLKDQDLGDAVYLSYRMFNEDGITLDDMTVEDISTRLGVPVHVHHEDLLEILRPWQ